MKLSIFSSLLVVLLIGSIITGCKEKKVKIKYEYGAFPDSTFNLSGINSDYDDYNITFNVDEDYNLTASIPVIFSSNRNTSGGKFDLVYGAIGYTFNKVTGEFNLESKMISDQFFTALTTKFNTVGDDFGPNRLFCSEDGNEYMFAASEVTENALDVKYSRYSPYVNSVPSIPAPIQATLFNSSSNDAYVSFNHTFDTAYFCSDRGGDFNIYYVTRPPLTSFNDWMTNTTIPATLINSINSAGNEKCPFVSGKVMIFASDRAGGSGGWDLYYSTLSGGVWSTPVNMGSEINTGYNEYRPVIGTDISFTNRFIIFSSDRSGGKGGYDLYLGPLVIE